MKKAIIFFLVLAVLSSVVFADNETIFYYKFEDLLNEGNTTPGYALQLGSNQGFVAGVVDNAIDLEAGSTDYAANISFDGDDIAQIRTIDCWVKPESVDSPSNEILSISDGTVNNWLLVRNGDLAGSLKIEAYIGGGGAKWAMPVAGVFSAGVETHLIVTWGSQGAALYIDGSLTPNSTDAATDVLTSSFTRIYFGNTYNGGGNYWDGLIDNCRFANFQYDTDDVTDSWNGGAGKDFGADVTPPVNSSWNVTSENSFSENSTIWNWGGFINISSDLLSITVEADENTNLTCVVDNDWNYTVAYAADSNYQAATTETTDHAYTIYDDISNGQHCLYCYLIDTSGNQGGSGCLNFTHWDSPDVNLTQPANDSSFLRGNVTFNFTSYFHQPLIVANISTNMSGSWKVNQTLNSSFVNKTKTSFDVINVSSGYFVWGVEVCNKKLCNTSVNYTMDVSVWINTTAPPGGSANSPSGAISEDTEFFVESGELIAKFPWQLLIVVFLFVYLLKREKKKK